MFKTFIFSLLLILSLSLHAEENVQIHNELRTMIHGLEDSINAKKYGELAQYFDTDFTVTAINQEVINSPQGIENFFESWFGPTKMIANLKIKLTADAMTKLYDNNRFGIVTGSGDEAYILSDGRTFDMKTRWSATVIQKADGSWKILTLHIGTNFLDNPLLNAVESSTMYIGIAGVVFGLLVGLLIGFLIFRKKIS